MRAPAPPNRRSSDREKAGFWRARGKPIAAARRPHNEASNAHHSEAAEVGAADSEAAAASARRTVAVALKIPRT